MGSELNNICMYMYNVRVSETRLRSLKGRLRSKGILNAYIYIYDDIFEEYEKNGISNKSLPVRLWLK